MVKYVADKIDSVGNLFFVDWIEETEVETLKICNKSFKNYESARKFYKQLCIKEFTHKEV